MKITLKNIGKIKEAIVEINAITVIAGENDTGKSTIGKALYAVFNSFYNVEEQIRKEKIQSIENILELLYRNTTSRLTSRVDFEEIADNIINNVAGFDDIEQLKSEIWKMIGQYDEYFIKYGVTQDANELVSRIYDVLRVSDEEFLRNVLNKRIGAEFNGQINNIYTRDRAEVALQIKDDIIDVTICNDEVSNINNRIDMQTEVLYFDDPFILDEQRFIMYRNHFNYMDHRTHLKNKVNFR